jgi:rubrerythrin
VFELRQRLESVPAPARYWQATMTTLQGSKTHQNLKLAFAHEARANRLYLYFAREADIEGLTELAGLFRDTAEGEAAHARGHLDYLRRLGDPATGMPIGTTLANLEAAIVGETMEYTKMYPEMAATAREEGFPEIAAWLEGVAKAERNHAERFQRGADAVRRQEKELQIPSV